MVDWSELSGQGNLRSGRARSIREAIGPGFCGKALAWEAAVEMDMFPFAVDQLPHASFFGRFGHG